MRKTLLILLAVVLVAGGGVTPALAAGPYLSLNGGATWVEDSDLSVDGFGDFAELSYETGYVADVALGYAYAGGGRIEFEAAYRENDVDELTLLGFEPVAVDGDVSSGAAMINGYFDFDTGTMVKPFIGVGLGYAYVELDDGTDTVDDSVFAYQAMAGCGFALSPAVTLDLQYRFFATDDPELEDGGIEVESEYLTHNAMLGLRFSF